MTQMMVQAQANKIQAEANQAQKEYNQAYINYLETSLSETASHNRSMEQLQLQQNQITDRFHIATANINHEKNMIDRQLGMLRLEFDQANEGRKREIEAQANELVKERNRLEAEKISLDDFHRTQQEEIDKRRNDLTAEFNQQQAIKWGHDYELGLRSQEVAEKRVESEIALNEARELESKVNSTAIITNANIRRFEAYANAANRKAEIDLARDVEARQQRDANWKKVTDTIGAIGNLARGIGSLTFKLKPAGAAIGAVEKARLDFEKLFSGGE